MWCVFAPFAGNYARKSCTRSIWCHQPIFALGWGSAYGDENCLRFVVWCVAVSYQVIKSDHTLVLMRPSHSRQSYEVSVKLKVAGTNQTGEGTYDLKNPYFRYSGMTGAAQPSGRRRWFKCLSVFFALWLHLRREKVVNTEGFACNRQWIPCCLAH